MKRIFMFFLLFISSITSLITFSLAGLAKDVFFLGIGVLFTIITLLVFAEIRSWKSDPFRE